MKKIAHVHILAVITALVLSAPGLAADDPEPDVSGIPLNSASGNEVAATVNNEPIKLADVNDAVKSVLQDRKVDPAALRQIQADLLSQLIDRVLVVQLLKKSGKMAPAEQITKVIDQSKKMAEEQKLDFAKTLSDRGLTEEMLRERLAKEISLASFFQSVGTDDVMRKYFEAHKNEFDGTEVRVSHILLRPDGSGSDAETERLKQLANKLREQIEADKVSFEVAAKRLSAGPSRRNGGDLGFILRQGLMLEPFAAAAFKLEKGKISEPVATPFGVHLIKVTDVKPGRKMWIEVKDQLKMPAAKERLEKIYSELRGKANIDFTGKCPHYKPGTRELAED